MLDLTIFVCKVPQGSYREAQIPRYQQASVLKSRISAPSTGNIDAQGQDLATSRWSYWPCQVCSKQCPHPMNRSAPPGCLASRSVAPSPTATTTEWPYSFCSMPSIHEQQCRYYRVCAFSYGHTSDEMSAQAPSTPSSIHYDNSEKRSRLYLQVLDCFELATAASSECFPIKAGICAHLVVLQHCSCLIFAVRRSNQRRRETGTLMQEHGKHTM